jgi:DNA-binding response OmpR family regulator
LQNETKTQTRVILAIEDDLQDVELLRIALAWRNCSWNVVSVQFARDAIMYLGRIGQYEDEDRYPRPNLIVLDLALPGMSGMEFLTWARHEPDIPPIVVLTYSKLEENRILAEKLGAKGYFVKSPDLKETAAMIETLLTLSTPPQISPGVAGAPQQLK